MTLYTKNPRDEDMVKEMVERGEILIEVTSKTLYHIPHEPGMPLEDLMKEWFVKYKAASHAFRDGSKIHGTEDILKINVLTDGGKEIKIDANAH
jgi:hypothetical protein